MNQFERQNNRLVEDKNFCDGIYGQIFEKLEDLSRIFDSQMAELGYGRIWAEKIAKIKAGKKLGPEQEVMKIVLEIAWKRELSDIERNYLLDNIFMPSRKIIRDDD